MTTASQDNLVELSEEMAEANATKIENAQDALLRWQKTFGIHEGAAAEDRKDHLNSLLIAGVLRFDQIGSDRCDAAKILQTLEKPQLARLDERLGLLIERQGKAEVGMTPEGLQSARALKALTVDAHRNINHLSDVGYCPVSTNTGERKSDAALEEILVAAATPSPGFDLRKDWQRPQDQFRNSYKRRRP